MAFGLHVGAVAQPPDKGAELLAVVGMDIVITHLYPHIIAEHRLAVQVIYTVLLQVETHHVVASDVERHRHGLLLVKHDIHLHTQFSLFFSMTEAVQGIDTHTLVPLP